MPRYWYWSIDYKWFEADFTINEIMLSQFPQLSPQKKAIMMNIKDVREFRLALQSEFTKGIKHKVIIDQINTVASQLREWNLIVYEHDAKIHQLFHERKFAQDAVKIQAFQLKIKQQNQEYKEIELSQSQRSFSEDKRYQQGICAIIFRPFCFQFLDGYLRYNHKIKNQREQSISFELCSRNRGTRRSIVSLMMLSTQQQQNGSKMNTLIEIFLPNREFGEALIINRDLRTDFRNLNIGAQYQAFFNTKEVVTSLGVKKEMNILTLPIFECFFTKVVCELLNLKQYEKKGSWKDSFQNDDFYYFILRNPLLHIIRQWLIYTRTRLFVFNRILNVLELLLIRQPIFRFRKGESSLSIKTYHFYGIYLLIEWKTTSLVWEFLSFIVDYLETKQKNFNFLFCCWVRLHLILLRRGSPYELSVRKDLEDGLRSMVLSKVRITSVDAFGNQVRGIQDHDYLDNLLCAVLPCF